MAVLAPLAALDAQQHALSIDIADLERDNFRDAQPGAVGGGECRLVLRRRCRAYQKGHFLDAEHCRYPPRIRHDGEPARQIRPLQRHREEEAQGRGFGRAGISRKRERAGPARSSAEGREGRRRDELFFIRRPDDKAAQYAIDHEDLVVDRRGEPRKSQ